MSNSIKVHVIGALHMKGVSKNGAGDPYDFSQVSYLTPASPIRTANCTRTVAGFEPVTINLTDPDSVIRLQSISLPCELNLDISPDPTNLQRNICVGFSEVTPLATESASNDDLKKSFDFNQIQKWLFQFLVFFIDFDWQQNFKTINFRKIDSLPI